MDLNRVLNFLLLTHLSFTTVSLAIHYILKIKVFFKLMVSYTDDEQYEIATSKLRNSLPDTIKWILSNFIPFLNIRLAYIQLTYFTDAYDFQMYIASLCILKHNDMKTYKQIIEDIATEENVSKEEAEDFLYRIPNIIKY